MSSLSKIPAGSRHPLHPVFVHLPIGVWLASLAFDIAWLAGGPSQLAVASNYCVLLGLAGVVLAAPTGLIEYFRIPRGTEARQLAGIHMLLNLFVTALYSVNFLIRRAPTGAFDVIDQVPLSAFVLSCAAYGILGVSGYIGGLLVYRYGAGQRRPEESEGRKLRRVA